MNDQLVSSNSFLFDVAQRISENHGNKLRNVAVVVPGHRPAVYIKKHLLEVIGGPFWAPQIFDISSFFETLLPGGKKMDFVESLLMLFKAYTETGIDSNPDLNSFLSWAGPALSDFNDIDNYLLDNVQVFKNLRDIKELEDWSFNSEELTEEQERFLQFWKDLEKLFDAFRSACEENQLFNSGLLKRMVVEQTDLDFDRWDHIYFVGFNALSKSETELIKRYNNEGKTTIFWDYNEFYVTNKWHEAGLFARQNQKVFGNLEIRDESLVDKHPDIQFHEATSNVEQALVAGNILKSMSKEQIENTAIILADESLLLPTLNALPKDIADFNVTMGYPFIQSDEYRLINGVLKAADDLLKKGGSVSTQSLLSIIRNPLLVGLRDSSGLVSQSFQKGVVKSNLDYLNANEWKGLISDDSPLQALNWIFSPPESWEELTRQLYALLEISFDPENDVWASEFRNHAYRVLKKLEGIASDYSFTKGVSSYAEIFKSYARRETIDFIGEPLTGLQIMGVLESRALDFENVILLGVNEGILPSSSVSQSFIPFELRQLVGLPGTRERDAIFAYYFYRLLHRSKNAHIAYTSQKDVFGSGEKSRYVTQLERDILKKRNNAMVWTAKMTGPHSGDIRVPSNEHIREAIIDRLERGISPSAINTFLKCPLDFYFRYVMGFSEPEEIEKTIHVSTFGSVVHKVLEDFFGENPGEVLLPETIEGWISQIKGKVSEAFDDEYSEQKYGSGANHLAWHVACIYTKRLLEEEIKELKSLITNGQSLVVESVEQKIHTVIPIEVNGRTIQLKLRGIIDRVDMMGDKLRIVDYKSGSVDQKDLDLKDVVEQLCSGKKAKALQLLAYARVYYGNTQTLPDQASIISMRKLSNGVMSVRLNKSEVLTRELMQDFDTAVQQIATQMLDPELGFEHPKDARFCAFCNQERD